MSIRENLALVRERIAQAAKRASRSPDSVTLMAVSKTQEPERIRQAYVAGVRIFGENRVQEFEGKCPALADLSDCRWHLIGHVQTNKAKKAVELFHGIDSVELRAAASAVVAVAVRCPPHRAVRRIPA